jgi:uncharacterized membrane protein
MNVPVSCPIVDQTSCAKVNESAYSEIFGVPVSLAGIIGYSVLLVNLYVIEKSWGFLTFVLLIFCALVFSLFLVAVSIFVIKAICIWCMVSAGAVFMAAGLCIWNLVTFRDDYLHMFKNPDGNVH